MRNFDRYDDDAPIIRRATHRSDGDLGSFLKGLLLRLVFLGVLLSGFIYLLWYVYYKPVDTWTSPYAISNVERDRAALREAAQRAEKEMSAEMEEELVAQRLVQNRQIDPYFPLTKKNRELIHKYWEKIIVGMSNREIVGLMKLLDLQYDEEGNVVDIPDVAEAKDAAEAKEKSEEITDPVHSFVRSAREDRVRKNSAAIEQSKEVNKWRKTYHDVKQETHETVEDVLNDSLQTLTRPGGDATIAVPAGIFPEGTESVETPVETPKDMSKE
ncbi:MAG: hypothetical protein Q4D98_01050 [Planctomycetia bacterium]|nr:hypothetical protein [Planctomycetia bacterium]